MRQGFIPGIQLAHAGCLRHVVFSIQILTSMFFENRGLSFLLPDTRIW